jgi:hypothetical protein
MPYIKQADRESFRLVLKEFNEVLLRKEVSVGDLNYLITSELALWLESAPISYARYNDVVGVLTCALLEMYRRRISSYEDKKVFENGDIPFYAD